MTTETARANAPTLADSGWLRDSQFDVLFIAGLALLGIGAALFVAVDPVLLFPIVFAADLWLLGYHHVISTFTRLAMDPDVRKDHPILLYVMPFVVFAACGAAVAGLGLWVMGTVYLYWQWWHYTRQSWGVAQAYRRKAGGMVSEPEWMLKLVHYGLPTWGILYRSATAPDTFLGLPLKTIPVPTVIVAVSAAVALGGLLLFTVSRARMLLQGGLPIAHTLYMITHFAVFACAYLFIDNITVGWLVVNVWHNAQYIAFVWMFNTKQHAKPGATELLIGRLSQPGAGLRYLGFCLLLTTVVYVPLQLATNAALTAGVASMVFVYSAINFHHYIVDSYIWKLRKPRMQRTLGLASA